MVPSLLAKLDSTKIAAWNAKQGMSRKHGCRRAYSSGGKQGLGDRI